MALHADVTAGATYARVSIQRSSEKHLGPRDGLFIVDGVAGGALNPYSGGGVARRYGGDFPTDIFEKPNSKRDGIRVEVGPINGSAGRLAVVPRGWEPAPIRVWERHRMVAIHRRPICDVGPVCWSTTPFVLHVATGCRPSVSLVKPVDITNSHRSIVTAQTELRGPFPGCIDRRI